MKLDENGCERCWASEAEIEWKLSTAFHYFASYGVQLNNLWILKVCNALLWLPYGSYAVTVKQWQTKVSFRFGAENSSGKLEMGMVALALRSSHLHSKMHCDSWDINVP